MNNIDILGFLELYIKDLIYILGTIASFFIGNKLRKINIKKEQVNVQSGELENVESALKIYRMMLTDLQEKLKTAEEAYIVIEERLHKAIENNKILFEENKKLKMQLNGVTGNN